ncbi:MAG: carbon-nitrogen family hydrolase [Anaerolineae bacterium]|nr:carbon-nitrogen family hydrolase [Anaerolineae bacterium]
MNIALGDVRKNTAQMEKWTVEAARRGSHMVVFPELWSTGYALDQSKELASTLNTGTFNDMSGAAVGNKISVVGSLLEKRGMEVSNSAAFFAPNGRSLGIYRKLHLFRLMDEHKWLQPGSSPLAMDLPWGNTGLAICYDLRFPELFRRYAVEGAKMIIIPAEWPIERIEHWRALLIARAIENQCYIVACNSAGQTGDAIFGGNSMIVDPWGKVVVSGGESPNLLTAEIEMDAVDEIRKRIPIFEDRRTDIY